MLLALFDWRKIMIITPTPNIEGKKITQYFGMVSGSVIFGAKVRITVPTNPNSKAISEMRQEAARLGANAIVGRRKESPIIAVFIG